LPKSTSHSAGTFAIPEIDPCLGNVIGKRAR